MSHESMEREGSLRVEKVFDAPQINPQAIPFKNSLESLSVEDGIEKPEMTIEFARQKSEELQDSLFVQSWLKSKSKNTIRAYTRIAEEFLNFVKPLTLRHMQLNQVQSFLEVRNSGRSSIALKSSCLKSLLSFGERSGYLSYNLGAFIRGIKTHSKITDRYLTETEVILMISKSIAPREEAIVRLLYSGGLRVSELVGLNWSDLKERSEGSGQIKVKGKGDRERVVVISKLTMEAILKLKNEQTQEYFPIFESNYGTKTRLTDRTVRDVIFKLALRAGILKKVSPHWLRHAHASHALDRGAPIHLVQTTLGHASVATTGKYLHARPEESSGRFLLE